MSIIEHPRTSFTSFEESTAEDWAIIAPQLQITQSFVAERVIDPWTAADEMLEAVDA